MIQTKGNSPQNPQRHMVLERLTNAGIGATWGFEVEKAVLLGGAAAAHVLWGPFHGVALFLALLILWLGPVRALARTRLERHGYDMDGEGRLCPPDGSTR